MDDNNYILPFQTINGYRYGGKLEFSNLVGNQNPVKRISRTEYVDLNGEVQKYQQISKNRSESLESLVRTMKRLSRYIEHNFSGNKNELWITLTYAENVTDSKRVYSDFKAFMKKIRRHYGHVEYISVLEPQKRGAWHIHALFKSDIDDYFYIANSHLQKLWKHGFVKVKKLKNSDNVASYVTAYLTDLKHEDGNNKKIEKGARLHLYPSGMNFYRMSRGIEKPEKLKGTKYEIFKQYGMNNSAYAPDKIYYHDIDLGDGKSFLYKREFYKMKYEGDDDESNPN
ncbi:replicative protein [Oceanobacillus piezotolerans]|uniref:Replicative protein n=1 Tax=Oceanobacillus piezotolerans TaxID=2448030 RepID=A0A498DCU2_9BACI|nr:replicative protein [Oceanobacillus piezotolerans]RLL39799.1 replicative protein [Oceanobacillus piezotolerans]